MLSPVLSKCLLSKKGCFPCRGELPPGCPCSAQPQSLLCCWSSSTGSLHCCQGERPLSTLEKGQGCLPSAAHKPGSRDCRWEPLFLSWARFLLLFKQTCCEREHHGNTPPSDGHSLCKFKDVSEFLRAVQGSLAWTALITWHGPIQKKNHPAMVSQPAEAKVRSQWPSP